MSLISKPPSSKSDYLTLFQLLQVLSQGGPDAQAVVKTVLGGDTDPTTGKPTGLVQTLLTGYIVNCSWDEVDGGSFADALPDWVKQHFDMGALKTWAKTTFGNSDAFAGNKTAWVKAASNSLGSYAPTLNLLQVELNRARAAARGGEFAGLSQESEFNIIERYCNSMTMAAGAAAPLADGITGFERLGELLKALTPPVPDPQNATNSNSKTWGGMVIVDNGWSPDDWTTEANGIVALIQSISSLPSGSDAKALNKPLLVPIPHSGSPSQTIQLTPLNLLVSLGMDPNSPSSKIDASCKELLNTISSWPVYDSTSTTTPPAQTTIGDILKKPGPPIDELATSLQNTFEAVKSSQVSTDSEHPSYTYSQDPLAGRLFSNFTGAPAQVASYGNSLTSALQTAQSVNQANATQILSLFQALLSVSQQVLNAVGSASPKS